MLLPVCDAVQQRFLDGRALARELRTGTSAAVAAGSWVPEMIALAGSEDCCGRVEEAACLREPDLEAARPDVFIFALCGLTLGQSLEAAAAAAEALGGAGGLWGRLPAVAARRVAVVDGTRVFSCPGPLLAESMEVLAEILQPEAQPYGHQGRLWQLLPMAGGEGEEGVGPRGGAAAERCLVGIR